MYKQQTIKIDADFTGNDLPSIAGPASNSAMSTQQQLLLDLKLDQTPTLENFVDGRNEELLGRLQALKAGRSFDALYEWGAEEPV